MPIRKTNQKCTSISCLVRIHVIAIGLLSFSFCTKQSRPKTSEPTSKSQKELRPSVGKVKNNRLTHFHQEEGEREEDKAVNKT